ncbi:glycosyltransferase [bacterium]|nr:MAG: glycosyltransferase [bacterium]
MKILILHDYLTVFGGAEQVLLSLLEVFPSAQIYTSTLWKDALPQNFVDILNNHSYKESFLKFLPKRKSLIPFYRKIAFLSFLFLDLDDFDIIIANTSGPATWCIRHKSKAKLIAYYHKIPSFSFFPTKNILKLLLHKLDSFFIKRFDVVITNSKFNQSNFRKVFDINAQVVYPVVQLEQNAIPTKKEDFFLFVGRLEKYKGITEIVQSCIDKGKKLIVVGKGSLMPKNDSTTSSKKTLPIHELIEYRGFVSEKEKFELFRKAKAFITAGGDREEFGITALESIFCLTPVIAHKRGGVVELVREFDGKSGNAFLFDQMTVQDISNTIEKFESNREIITNNFHLLDHNLFSHATFQTNLLKIIKL